MLGSEQQHKSTNLKNSEQFQAVRSARKLEYHMAAHTLIGFAVRDGKRRLVRS
jgi:hypothetical protein